MPGKERLKIQARAVHELGINMTELFGCSADNISLHLENIYKEKELDEHSTIEVFSVVEINNKRLSENQANFLLYSGNDGKVNVEVFLKDETVWLTQKAIGKLFGKERSVITKHLKNIFASGELEEKSNVQKMYFSHSDKPS